MKVAALLVVVMVVGARVANAQVAVTVQLSPDGEQLANQLGVSPADFAARIQDRVNDAYDAAVPRTTAAGDTGSAA